MRFTFILCLVSFNLFGQDTVKQILIDTLTLKEIPVSAYPLTHSQFSHTSSVENIEHRQITSSESESITQIVNLRPGIRMEERSPGSYRLSIRGSLLRSPFGVRNIKFYLDGFPFTDAGGNTYLNLLDKNFFNSIEIIKGPDGSFFGSNTGGAVLIKTQSTNDSTSGGVRVSYSSFKTLYTGGDVTVTHKNYSGKFLLSRYDSDGYRRNSAINRMNFVTSNNFQYSKRNSIGVLLFATDLKYRTPGGLTLTQAMNDPEAARASTPTLRSAEDQKSGILNKTYFAGLSHTFRYGENGKQEFFISYSKTDFENPFITNYETRDERTFSIRGAIKNIFFAGSQEFNWTTGFEGQQTNSSINNYGNNYGEKDSLQASDEAIYKQGIVFAGLSIHLTTKLIAEISSSGNVSQLKYRNIKSSQASFNERNFEFQLMPRIAISYSASENIHLRMSASKGYSLPTLAEIRPSTNIFLTGLNPEEGWSYECGIRLRNNNRRISISVTAFYFRLHDAIVRRVDENDNEYFINAGGTNQPGLECSAYVELIPSQQSGFIRFMSLTSGFTFNHFTFTDYKNGDQDFSGNNITGVPQNIFSSELKISFASGTSIALDHYYSDKLPLNDANGFYADAYNLFDAQVENYFHLSNCAFTIKAGLRNIFNEFYSSGNDLNAVGNRFYNPAPGRNYFGAIEVRF